MDSWEKLSLGKGLELLQVLFTNFKGTTLVQRLQRHGYAQYKMNGKITPVIDTLFSNQNQIK